MKPVFVFGFAGDGGQFWSGGFEEYLRKLDAFNWSDVRIFQDSGRNWKAPVDLALSLPADQPIAGIGYSLGGWGAAWWQYYMKQKAPKRRISLIAGIDPAGRLGGFIGGLHSEAWLIQSNVDRCLCIYNSVPLSPTSWFYGGGKYQRAPDGPQIEYIGKLDDHLMIQNNKSVQRTITLALGAIFDAQLKPKDEAKAVS